MKTRTVCCTLMETFKPILNVLPESQQWLWTRLNTTPRHFVLYGDTALALRLGHRESVDFDFFSSAASAIYGHQYNPILTLEALSYFSDLSPSISENIQAALIAAVKNVSLNNLPEICAFSTIGEGLKSDGH